MKLATPRPAATFYWQGLLVLLPVFVLAGLGLYSLRQDRLLAAQEARQHAARTLQQIADALDEAGNDLARYSWLGSRQQQFWSGTRASSAFPNVVRFGPVEQQAALERDWNDHTRDDPAPSPQFNFCVFDASGRLEYPRDYPKIPEPAPWLERMTDSQRAAWTRARADEASGARPEVVRGDYDKFLAFQPGFAAAANARFELLLLDLKTNPPASAVSRLLEFVETLPTGQAVFDARSAARLEHDERFQPVAAESGLPLGSVVLARLLELAKPARITEPVIDSLRQQFRDAPSVLMPRLLEQSRALALPPDPNLRGNYLMLWPGVENAEQIRALAREVSSRGPFSGTGADLWVGPAGKEWLAVLSPVSDAAWSATNQAGIARFYPKALLEHALRRAVGKSRAEIPAYLSLEVFVEDRRLELANPPHRPVAAPDPAPVLEEENARLLLPSPPMAVDAVSATPKPSSNQAPPGSLAALASIPGALSAGPAVSLRLYLSRPDLLYAAQHRHTLWFVWLIAAAAAAAVVGFLASRRAFLRQQQLGEMKTNLVSSVSHELRAPIASVRLMAEALERGRATGPAKQNEYFRFIVQECRRLSSLVENLLDFSRIEQGRKEYEFESTDLNALVLETVKLMEPAAAERQIQIETLLPPDPLAATADGSALQQALVNLVDNALKHSPANSTVTIGLEQTGAPPAAAALWVEDRGPGIPASDHARIFERFYRRGSELRRETRGVGIGLSIVKHIVEAHHGRIVVRSAEGCGSRFTIELPLDPAPAALAAPTRP